MKNRMFLAALIAAMLPMQVFAYDLGFKAPAIDGYSNVTNPEQGAIVLDSSSGTFMGNMGTPTSPAWVSLGSTGSSPTSSYAQAYMSSASSWSTSSGSFADPTNSGGNSLTVRTSSGITLTAAAGSLPGITFTPGSSTAVYLITAQVGIQCTVGNGLGIQLTDGTSVITTQGGWVQPGSAGTTSTLTGVYAPATTSAVTVKLQLLANGGSSYIVNNGSSVSNVIEWTVVRIN